MRFFLLALFLCSCSNFKPLETNSVVSCSFIEDKLCEKFSRLAGAIHLDDYNYHLVDENYVKEVAFMSWRPWLEEKGDCDDQASRILFVISEKYYLNSNARYSPAIGRLNCSINGQETHNVVWFLTKNGLIFYDPTAQEILNEKNIVAWESFCK